jgi:hypothetical protein
MVDLDMYSSRLISGNNGCGILWVDGVAAAAVADAMLSSWIASAPGNAVGLSGYGLEPEDTRVDSKRCRTSSIGGSLPSLGNVRTQRQNSKRLLNEVPTPFTAP